MKPATQALFLLLISSSCLLGQTVTIEGVVTDWSNSPLQGVTVQMSRDGRGAGSWAYIGDTTTDKDGNYRFRIPKGDPLVIYYSRPAYHPSEVKRLSGKRNAIIGVVLRSASEKLARNEAREQLLTLEGMIAMSKTAPPETAQRTLGTIQASLSSLEPPEDLTKRVSETWSELAVLKGDSPGTVKDPNDGGAVKMPRTAWEISIEPPL